MWGVTGANRTSSILGCFIFSKMFSILKNRSGRNLTDSFREYFVVYKSLLFLPVVTVLFVNFISVALSHPPSLVKLPFWGSLPLGVEEPWMLTWSASVTAWKSHKQLLESFRVADGILCHNSSWSLYCGMIHIDPHTVLQGSSGNTKENPSGCGCLREMAWASSLLGLSQRRRFRSPN